MATDDSFIEYLRDQIKNAGDISFRKMFGEYAMYCNSKVVALVCDNQLFVKKTQAGAAHIGKVKEGFAYPGAKASFLIDRLDDREWLAGLIRATEKELPLPKPKKKKQSKKKV